MAKDLEKTTAIPHMIEDTENTGLVTQGYLDALEAKRLQAGEKIRELLIKQKKGDISLEQANAEIERIQQGLQDRTNALGSDDEILT